MSPKYAQNHKNMTVKSWHGNVLSVADTPSKLFVEQIDNFL